MSKPEGILKNLPDLDYGRDVKDIFYEDADEDGSGISDTQVKADKTSQPDLAFHSFTASKYHVN